ncbi:MAG: saccharopine dehydrogenase [Roseinatronobacter sp.]
MTHLWVRAEQRADECRVGVTPDGVAALVRAGIRVTIEDSPDRVIPLTPYLAAGALAAPYASWPDAPSDAIIFGLKELPENDAPLRHRHIYFGHAFKGQAGATRLFARFRAGGGALYDLEYLTDQNGRRVAAFGYWAGYAGAAVSLLAYAAQENSAICPPVARFADKGAMTKAVAAALSDLRPSVLVVGALGRVGTGASDLCRAVGAQVIAWDVAETAHGGPFPQILAADVFLNCILAGPGCPVFVPASALTDTARGLRVIGDIACDPSSDFSPIKVNDRVTCWAAPVHRVAQNPVLDVMAIDNLPSLLPLESSHDFAAQLLPHLLTLSDLTDGVWARARAVFDAHIG